MKFCTKCGKPLEPPFRFCTACGAPAEDDVPPPPPPPPNITMQYPLPDNAQAPPFDTTGPITPPPPIVPPPPPPPVAPPPPPPPAAMRNKVCGECGQELPPDANVCTLCSAPV